MPLRPVPRPARHVVRCAVIAICLLAPAAVAGAAGAAGPADPLVAAADDRHGRSVLALELVDRTFDVDTGAWTLVVEGRLDSRALCLPVLFDCVVEPQEPAGATLSAVDCLSPWWNHLGSFDDRCIKQAFVIGHDQKFRFTYVTDPGVAPAALDVDVRVGRGFLPVIIRELTAASLQIDLTASADVVKQCPAVGVVAGEVFECEITVSSPDPGDAPPPIDVAVLTDSGVPGELVTDESLTGPAGWSCADSTCTLSDPTFDPGQSAVFTYRATATATRDGGTFENTATLSYGVGTPDATATSSDRVVVVGELDTDLVVEKVAMTASARPGEAVSWVVSITNDGLPADDVVLTDLVVGAVEGLSVRYLDGVGTWECAAERCSTSSMTAGVARFRVDGTLAASATPGTVVNQVDVVWTNDVFGPDHPAVAGAAIEVLGAAVVPEPRTPTTSTPASLAFTG
ncbi:MAG: hypothetical protein ACK4V6_10260 [Microthrixaceae bacterium]